MGILLTGGTGFVGRNLSSLINVPCRYVVRSKDRNKFESVHIVENIDENTDWDGAFEGCTSVIHLAGLAHASTYSQADFESVNVFGTARLALAAAKAGVKRFVFVSSIGVNGNSTSNEPFSPTSLPLPHNHYARSKLSAEEKLSEISKETGLEIVIIRPTLVYGANAPGNFGMLTKLVQSMPILPFGSANNRRDFIAVQNLAHLILVCVSHKNAGGHIFLASDGETVSIKDFTNAIAQGLGKRVIQLPVPIAFIRCVGRIFGKTSVIEQLFGNLEVNSSNLQEVIEWTAPLSMAQAMASLQKSGKQ